MDFFPHTPLNVPLSVAATVLGLAMFFASFRFRVTAKLETEAQASVHPHSATSRNAAA